MDPSQPDVDFDAAYRELPPWEIDRPQPVIASLAAAGTLAGPVLDVGCGTGENALELARHGLEVVGVDSSRVAIERARAKAEEGSLDVEFLEVSAHDLTSLDRRFATVLDSALLHVIPDKSRYADQLASMVEPGGLVILLEISDRADIPYPKISESEIRAAFGGSMWQIESLEIATYETHLGTFPAWLGTVRASS